MIMPALISLLVGMLVAQRFKVLSLLPVIPLSAVFTIAVGAAHAEADWFIVATTALAIVTLQVGYLLGLAVHQLMVLVRASRINSRSLSSTLPRRRTAH